jgi:transcriptional regulator with XRE-family HTH domain
MAAGLSQEALAAAARLTPIYLSRVESSKSTPSITAARALAQGLGCAAWEVIKEAEELPGPDRFTGVPERLASVAFAQASGPQFSEGIADEFALFTAPRTLFDLKTEWFELGQ